MVSIDYALLTRMTCSRSTVTVQIRYYQLVLVIVFKFYVQHELHFWRSTTVDFTKIHDNYEHF
jgi:hypothetical protein